MKGIAIGLGVLWCLCGLPGLEAARADEGEQQAKVAYEKAMAEFGLGNYAQAAEHYEAAFRLKPDGALLYNAAQAHRLAGNKKRAVDLYRNFVRLYGGRSPLAQDAKKRIAELERTLAEENTATSTATSPGASAPATPAPPASAAPVTPPTASPTAPPPSPIPTAGQRPPPTFMAAPPAPAPVPAAQPPPPTFMAAPPAPAPVPAAAPPPVLAAAPPPAIPETPPPEAASPAVILRTPPPSRPRRSLFARPWFWGALGATVAAAAIVLFVASRPLYPDANLGAATVGN